MSESEEKFECVFGYGECPVRTLMAREQKEAHIVAHSLPVQLSNVPPELARFMQSMIASFSQVVQTFSGLRDVGVFCVACPKAKGK